MTGDQLERLKSVLLELEGCPASAIDGRVWELLSDDPELHAEALALLRQEQSTSNLQSPISDLLPEALSAVGRREAECLAPGDVGRQIGAYRLLERLGAGGMGVVWRAEQLEPIRRQVALKILRGGWDPEVLRFRFEAERRSLALMDHPAIARFYDAGSDDHGQPFFVMELVEGTPISDFVRGRRMTVDERLALFASVCRAVQHAHQRGIIHRDLKPTNILVSEVDGVAMPKVIDFGIAKAIDPDSQVAPFGTVEGQVLGTLEYMSPEQAGGKSGELDTRTDVYSLGAMLLEVLTDQPPRDFRNLPLSESLHLLVTTPILVSGRTGSVTPLGDDLFTIIRKATDPDPARRYESAGALANDLERFRRSEPIAARPPDTAYQLRLLIRRHRVAVAFAGVVGAALVVVGVTAIVLLSSESRALKRAEMEALRAEAINDFMSQVLASPAPGQLGRDVRVVEALDRALLRLDATLGDRQDLRVSVERRMAETYRALGEEDRGDSLATAALAMGRRVLQRNDPELRQLLIEAGRFANRFERYAQTDSLLLEASKLYRRTGSEPEDLELVTIQSLRAIALGSLGRHAEAEKLMRESIARAERTSARPELGTLHNRLGELLRSQGRQAEAREELERAVQILSHAGPTAELELADALCKLAITLDITTDAARVDSLESASIALYRKLDVQNLDLATVLFNIAAAHIVTGRFAKAESMQLEAMELFEAKLGRKNGVIAIGLNNLGYCALARDEPAAALRWLLESEAIGRRIGQEDEGRAALLSNIVLAYGDLGQHERAIHLARECVELRARLTPGGAKGYRALACLGQAYLEAGRPDSALLILSTLDRRAADPNARSIQRLMVATYRALSLADLGRAAEARAALAPLIPEILRTDSPWLEARDLRRDTARRADKIGLPVEAEALRRAIRGMVRS